MEKIPEEIEDYSYIF